MELSAKNKSFLNAAIAILAAVIVADYIYVNLFANKPIVEALQPLIGMLAAVVGGLLVYTHFKHKPVL